ncbi:two-component sensor histidine kinase [Niastella yeongjuensis]|uniref:histidine kinase n=1 Tax=Niastella yeongjuensis TaxID=354355 RepID=A0A1V9EX53_9BACT|nr:ATP-binding protein [Niastella yeongjuensis]OQP50706.1 two-component sensor histidine kinase [Niastella yeongjuensis]SEN21741.1 His Kinase A (phospho-acceptor) domain-containing protein [Niastella yeongjuensis]
MDVFTKKRLAAASIVYWLLLGYIVVALVWWFIALQRQNHQMISYKMSELKMDDPTFQAKYQLLVQEKHIKEIRNIGEGSIFLAVILIASIFVYQAVRRQIRLQNQQENFMMAITHELKTPIAIAKLNLETLLKYSLPEEKKQKMLQATLQETNRLNTLASNILVSSQLEGGRYRISKEELDLSDLVKTTYNDFLNRFPDRTFHSEIEPEIDIDGDPLLLQILVNNLIENAIKYSPKEGIINCKLSQKNKTILFQVQDEGAGIPDDEKKRVFEKFYRIGNETTRTTKGTGLGLYLCKKIVEDHHGHIKVADNLPRGSNFMVSFTVKHAHE